MFVVLSSDFVRNLNELVQLYIFDENFYYEYISGQFFQWVKTVERFDILKHFLLSFRNKLYHFYV